MRFKVCYLVILILLDGFTILLPAQQTFWPDPIAHHVIPPQTAGLTHGPMLGRPGATSMRVWVRTAEPSAFRVRYAKQLPLSADGPAVAGTTTVAADNTGIVDLSDLEPDTRYYYGIELKGKLADTRVVFHDPWPSFRTLPDKTTFRDELHNPKGLFNLGFSIGAGACQDPVKSGGQYTDPPVWYTILREHGDEIHFHFMNGDYTYEEGRDGSLEGIRYNYRLYMERAKGMARLQRHLPWLFMYDDHEVHDNLFGAGEVGCDLKKSRYMDRDFQLGPWNEYAGWANHTGKQRGPMILGDARVEKDRDVLHDPNMDFSALKPEQVSTILVRTKDPNVGTYGLVKILDKQRLQVKPAFRKTGTISYSVGTHHYYDWKLGNCHFFAIDTRGERSRFNKEKLNDPASFLIGETQRTWLLNGIRRTDADFVFVISSVGLVVPHSAYHVHPSRGTRSKGDGFPGFVHERELILNALDKVNKPILFFTGDVHNSVSAQVTDNIWEFMVAPLNSNAHPIGTLGNMPYSGWYTNEGRRVRINWVAGWPNNVPFSRLHTKIYAVVRINNVLKTARPEGEGYQFVAYDHPQVIVSWHDGYAGNLLYAESVSTFDLVPALNQRLQE